MSFSRHFTRLLCVTCIQTFCHTFCRMKRTDRKRHCPEHPWLDISFVGGISFTHPPPKLQLRHSTMLDQLTHVQGLWLCRAELRVLKYDFRHWILVGDSSGFEIHFLFMLLRLVYLLGLSHTHTYSCTCQLLCFLWMLKNKCPVLEKFISLLKDYKINYF